MINNCDVFAKGILRKSKPANRELINGNSG
jgi:hypothetical protein